jgi:DNA (cytosine-5)-methyltransferase 1
VLGGAAWEGWRVTAYYNEINPYCAKWLRNLIAAGHIAPGDVDERSIEDVRPDDLVGYAQCHFFAGLGGWSLALRLAGVADGERVWTGSCPCQPFSAAGKGEGFADKRHLWPAWFHLVSQRAPAIVLGEQVASKDGLEWFDLVRADLESKGYAVGGVDYSAVGQGATHIRQRLWFVANADQARLQVRHGHRKLRTPETAFAWRELERVHAEGAWASREAESEIPVFADGVPNRVGRTCAYGNAIVPQVAQAFIEAVMEAA